MSRLFPLTAAVALALALALLEGCASSSPADPDPPACEVTDSCEPPPCEPVCAARECGGDGCGGTCGACAPGEACDAAFACVPELPGCVPACAGRACGDDGCGGSCGACEPGATCDEGGACTPGEEPILACPAGEYCVRGVHEAWVYDCGHPSSSPPFTCTPLYLFPVEEPLDTVAQCDMVCTGGESACHEGDTDLRAECRACLDRCEAPVFELCDEDPPGVCPAPCACR